jgi:hypothetical protein
VDPKTWHASLAGVFVAAGALIRDGDGRMLDVAVTVMAPELPGDAFGLAASARVEPGQPASLTPARPRRRLCRSGT